MDINGIFNDFARTFEEKIDNDYFIKLQFEITDEENGIWQIDVKDGKVFLYNEVKIEPETTFILSKETLIKMYNNEINACTAFSNEPNEKGEMCSLIEPKNKTEDKKVYKGKKLPEEMYNSKGEKISEEFLTFIYRFHKFSDFFSKDYPTKINVENENCVKLHGVNGIGLYSNPEKGIVHAYFSIKKGERFYEPAIEFSLYVLNGKGILIVGDEKYDIEAKKYYHMNPKERIFIENYEDEHLEILYI
jgi:hypothetical protein